MIAVVERFLPRQSRVVESEAGQYESILKADIDDDGNEEILVLYEYNDKYYLMGLKYEKDEWHRIFNRETRYHNIRHYQLVQFDNEGGYHILIGGQLKKNTKKQLMVLEWRFDYLTSLNDQYIVYDDLHVYADEETQKIVIQIDEESETICTTYKYKDRKLEKDEERDDLNTLEDNKIENNKIENNKIEKQYLVGMIGSLYQKETEEDIFLIGNQEAEVEGITQLKVVATTHNQRMQHMLAIPEERVYTYGIIVGHFLGKETEEIFLKTNEDKEGYERGYWLLVVDDKGIRSCLGEYINIGYTSVQYRHYFKLEIQYKEECFILDLSAQPSTYLEKWYTEEGRLKEERLGSVESKARVYALDRALNEQYALCMEHRIWDSLEEKVLGRLIRIFEGIDGQLVLKQIQCMIG
ncbi:MAG: hypothetical protein ACRDDX_06905 [Cellulosilyticaceae bacterium]